MALATNKELKLYYSIGEVAKMFNVSETLLRFWEKQFPQISPRKSGRNIRQYSKEDIEEVRLVYNLVKVRGMKLAAAREALRLASYKLPIKSKIVARKDLESQEVGE